MSLSAVERIILRNQFLILEKLYPDQAARHACDRTIVERGYTFFCDSILKPGIDTEVSDSQFHELTEALIMFDLIQRSFDCLPDKSGINPCATRWCGYDPVSEGHLHRLAMFWFQRTGRPEPPGGFDSAVPMAETYRRMLRAWYGYRNVRIPLDTLVREELDIILDARASTERSPDIAALLRPLATGQAGAGVDLRLDSAPTAPYQRLRGLRAAARAGERAPAMEPDVGRDSVTADWRMVRDLCLRCFEETRDFQIAAWLLEALVRLDGLPGLAAGASLLSALVERYWEEGFPGPDGDEPDDSRFAVRMSSFAAMADRDFGIGSGQGTVSHALYGLPLFRLPDGCRVSVYDWCAAEQGRTVGDEAVQQQRRARGIDDIGVLRRAAAAADLGPVAEQAGQAETAWNAMAARIGQRCDLGILGIASSPLDSVSRLLGYIRDIALSAGNPAV